MTCEVVPCPLCGAEAEMPATRVVDTGFAVAVVVTDPGTVWRHVRDEHPEVFAAMCEARRKMNAHPHVGCTPRKVDGTFLNAGEDVGDVSVRSA